ncbi:MAG TPA: LysR family transcriptional regulator [Candidatus Tetragenococcus pullicola]|nr:LysR family transcriptional regulator [Candidatus Tetragenococcus pullicola]
MNIQQLRYFLEIANTNNLSAAARNLFVTQPTLSLSLKKMESELQTTLFTHTESPFQLTKTGLYLYEEGQQLVEQFDHMIETIHSMNEDSKKKKDTIRLGITTLFSMQYMEEISTYLATHPHVDLIIKQDGSPHMQEMLVHDEIDLGLVSFPNLYPEVLWMEALNPETNGYHVYVVVPEANPLSQAHELTFSQLKNQRFSSLTTHFVLGKLLIQRANDSGFEPTIVFHNDDLQVLLHSLKQNDSICILPIEYKEVGKSDGLKWIPLKDKHAFFPIGIALRKDLSISKNIRDFIEIISRH